LDSVEARLNTLRAANGLLSYEAQAKELTKGYVRALTERDAGAQREVQARMRRTWRRRAASSASSPS
jgi:hypothetical protein